MKSIAKCLIAFVVFAFVAALPLAASAKDMETYPGNQKNAEHQGGVDAMAGTMSGHDHSSEKAFAEKNELNAMNPRNMAERTVLRASRMAFEIARQDPTVTIPSVVMDSAVGFAVFPAQGDTNTGSVPGTNYASGVLLSRQDDGSWTRPLMMSLSDAGPYLVAQKGTMDLNGLVLIIKDPAAMNQLAQNGSFTIGINVNAAAGYFGRNVFQEEVQNAQVVTYQRNNGIFLGIAPPDGARVSIDKKASMAYYDMGQSDGDQSDASFYNRILEAKVDGKSVIFEETQVATPFATPKSAWLLQMAVEDVSVNTPAKLEMLEML